MLGNRVLETTTTTGTGDITVAGATLGYLAFSDEFSNGDTVYYVIEDTVTGDFEIGYAEYNTNQILRSAGTVIRSSNADALVNLAAGNKNVFCSPPSGRHVYVNSSNVISVGVDLWTDRWASSGDNTLVGYDVAGNDALSKAGGGDNGRWNTAFGYQSLYDCTTGYGNVALGPRAIWNNTDGYHNIGIGYWAAGGNTSGFRNIGVGLWSLESNQTGDYNVAMGYQALKNTTGNNNLALGSLAGDALTSGSSNIIIGYGADVPSATASNQLSIGNLIYGNTSTACVGIGSAFSAPDEALQVDGNVHVNDSDKVLFGTGKDASIYYNGTDLYIDPKEAGSGRIRVPGAMTVDEGVQIGINNSLSVVAGGGNEVLFTGTNTANILQYCAGKDLLVGARSGGIWFSTDNWGSYALVIHSTSNVLLGTTTAPTGTQGKVLCFGDNGGDPTMSSGIAGIYAKDVSGTLEMFAIGDDNTQNQISAHDPLTQEWIHHSYSPKRGRKLVVRMERVIRALEKLTGETFMEETFD